MRYVISRHWNNPEIGVSVTEDSIGVSMPIEDYMRALVAEMGSPALLLTQAALLKRMQEASRSVQMKAQEATRQAL